MTSVYLDVVRNKIAYICVLVSVQYGGATNLCTLSCCQIKGQVLARENVFMLAGEGGIWQCFWCTLPIGLRIFETVLSGSVCEKVKEEFLEANTLIYNFTFWKGLSTHLKYLSKINFRYQVP